MNSNVYEKRVVAFVDILGFKNLIANTSQNDDEARKLLSVLKYIENVKIENDKGYFADYDFREKDFGKEVSVFSDSIVISYPLTKKGALFLLLMDLIYLQIDMMLNGIFIRGGISCGQLYHDDNVLFGPAMVNAYKLESEDAKYPRIILERETIDEAVSKPEYLSHSREEELKWILGLLRPCEADNQLFIDILVQQNEFDDVETYIDWVLKVKEAIECGLKSTDPKVLEKYKWMKEYYNGYVDDGDKKDIFWISD
jgi:hypothetical protein